MGDKGKKDKDKDRKHKTNKHDQEIKRKIAKQPKRPTQHKAWRGALHPGSFSIAVSLDGPTMAGLGDDIQHLLTIRRFE